MKLEVNTYDDNMIYLRPENQREREVLKDMWENGIEVCGHGSFLAIISKRLFGSGLGETMNKRDFLSKEFQTACAIYHIHDKELGDATMKNIIKVSGLRPTIVAESIRFLQGWSIVSLEPVMLGGAFTNKFKYYIRGMSENNIRELYERYWFSQFIEKGEDENE